MTDKAISKPYITSDNQEQNHLPPKQVREHILRDIKEAQRNNLPLTGNYAGFNFTGTDLTGVIFERANLQKANFTGAQLGQTVFVGCNMAGADFSDQDIPLPPHPRQGDGLVFNACYLKGANMQNLHAPYSVFSNMNTLAHAPMLREMPSLDGLDMQTGLLLEVNMAGARFENSNFNNVVAYKLCARKASFELVALNQVTFIDADVAGANLNVARAKATINSQSFNL